MHFPKKASVVALAFALAVFSSDSHARKWKPASHDLANDYVLIEHNKSNGEITLLMWVAPEIIAEADRTVQLAEILGEYLLLGVVTMKVSDLAEVTFDADDEITVTPFLKGSIRPSSTDSLPPVVNSIAFMLGDVFAKAMGPLGEGLTWHIFRGTDIRSCNAGGFTVSYKGEDYRYETPIPGCG